MEKLMTQPVKVTVITTVYNAVNTIEDTILSVINQTYPNIEYVVIDGGSTDGTLNVINSYRDKIARLISEPDKGIADGFNKGIGMATGEWIGMVNGDDWYAPNAVELMMDAVSDEDNICCGNILLVGQNGYKRIKKSKVSWLNFGMFIMHPTCFVRRAVYKRVGKYDTYFRIAMDFDMFLRIRRAGYKIKYIDELITYMRTGGASADINKMHKEEMAVMRRHLGYPAYPISWMYKHLDVIRWKYFYKDAFTEPRQII
jgi:glycosyltransferase involved in cell wall biosynthesis